MPSPVTQIAAALDTAHAKGLVHRDVKPANVRLVAQEDGEHAYLTDFGIAKATASETAGLTAGRPLLGTVDYLAPERSSTAGHPRRRLYALACLLYELLAAPPHSHATPTSPPSGPMSRSPAVAGRQVRTGRPRSRSPTRPHQTNRSTGLPAPASCTRRGRLAGRAASCRRARPRWSTRGRRVCLDPPTTLVGPAQSSPTSPPLTSGPEAADRDHRAGGPTRPSRVELAARAAPRFEHGVQFVALARSGTVAGRLHDRPGARATREQRRSPRARRGAASRSGAAPAARRRRAPGACGLAAAREVGRRGRPLAARPHDRAASASPASRSTRSSRSRRATRRSCSRPGPVPSSRASPRHRGDEGHHLDLGTSRRPAADDRAEPPASISCRGKDPQTPRRAPRPPRRRPPTLRHDSRRCGPRSTGATSSSSPTAAPLAGLCVPGRRALEAIGALFARPRRARRPGTAQPHSRGRRPRRRATLLDARDHPRVRRRATRASGRAEVTRQAQATHMLELAEQAELHGPRQLEWLDRLEAEHDNIRAALAWALEPDAELATRIGAGSLNLEGPRSPREGHEWLGRLIAATSVLSLARAIAMFGMEPRARARERAGAHPDLPRRRTHVRVARRPVLARRGAAQPRLS